MAGKVGATRESKVCGGCFIIRCKVHCTSSRPEHPHVCPLHVANTGHRRFVGFSLLSSVVYVWCWRARKKMLIVNLAVTCKLSASRWASRVKTRHHTSVYTAHKQLLCMCCIRPVGLPTQCTTPWITRCMPTWMEWCAWPYDVRAAETGQNCVWVRSRSTFSVYCSVLRSAKTLRNFCKLEEDKDLLNPREPVQLSADTWSSNDKQKSVKSKPNTPLCWLNRRQAHSNR